MHKPIHMGLGISVGDGNWYTYLAKNQMCVGSNPTLRIWADEGNWHTFLFQTQKLVGSTPTLPIIVPVVV